MVLSVIKMEAMAALEVSPSSGDGGHAAKTAIASSPTIVMPQYVGRCFESSHMKTTLPAESQKDYYSWGCGTSGEMMLLGFDTIDSCRDAFYCSVQNPVGVMQSEAPVPYDDPLASCESKLTGAMVPFLSSDQGVSTATPAASAAAAALVVSGVPR